MWLRVIERPFRGMPVGYEFTAPADEAQRMVDNRRAERVEDTKRAYKRRDMQAEE